MKAKLMAANPNIPVVDVERIERTYAELKRMEIRLDPNPIEYGPKRFNNRIAQVRAMLTRLEQLFLQTSEDLHYFKRQISSRNALYELEKRDLMVNDTRVRVGRSQGEREALADVQLRNEIEEIQKLQMAASDLESLMVVIKAKRTDLKDIQGRMREQMKLIEHDIGMGARWGNNAPPSFTNESVNKLDGLLADVDSSLGIVDDGTGAPHDPLEEEEDGEEEDGEEEDGFVEAEDPNHDPAPHAEATTVLILGEEEAAAEPEEGLTPIEDELSGLLPEEGAEGQLPENHTAQEYADDFLDALSSAGDEDETKNVEQEDAESSINDLIASLSDD